MKFTGEDMIKTIFIVAVSGIVGTILVYSAIAYVAVHFIKKVW